MKTSNIPSQQQKEAAAGESYKGPGGPSSPSAGSLGKGPGRLVAHCPCTEPGAPRGASHVFCCARGKGEPRRRLAFLAGSAVVSCPGRLHGVRRAPLHRFAFHRVAWDFFFFFFFLGKCFLQLNSGLGGVEREREREKRGWAFKATAALPFPFAAGLARACAPPTWCALAGSVSLSPPPPTPKEVKQQHGEQGRSSRGGPDA